MIKLMRRRPGLQGGLLASPATIFLVIFFLAPFFIVLAYSFVERGTYGGVVWTFTLENYQRAFDPLYLNTFWRSGFIAVMTTIFCLLLGYPMAYLIATADAKWRNLLLLGLMIPFWTNFLIRTYAWLNLLRTNTGLINVSLMHLGLIHKPLPLFGNNFAIILGLVYGWLPDMVLPCFAAITRLDKSLLEAASDLYAPGWSVFWRIIFPLTLPGIVAGSILVLIPSLGAFIAPALLGGGKTLMIGNIINNQFLAAHDWPFGSALSTIMIIVMLIVTVIYFRSTRKAR